MSTSERLAVIDKELARLQATYDRILLERKQVANEQLGEKVGPEYWQCEECEEYNHESEDYCRACGIMSTAGAE